VSTTEAHLYEIFSSIQGEGLYVGTRQIFIRFLMCNMSCQYCDSVESLVPHKTFRLEQTPGKRDFVIHNNPATIDQLLGFIDHFDKPKGLHHSVALTGGEPLLQVDFLKNLIPKIKEKGLKVYLETNGTMPERMKEIVELVDTIAMDIKLPSMTGSDDRLAEHRRVLEVAAINDTFVKIVYGKNSKPIEIENASKMISEVSADIPLVLQPVTPTKDIKHGPTSEQTLTFHTIARRHLKTVRVIPQTHKAMGQL
jgi:7-carboxy-7-deazaguanine synthase